MWLSQDGPLYILRGHRLYFPEYIVFLSLEIDFVLENSADPDEMAHHAAFYQGLTCLPKYPFSGVRFCYTKRIKAA